MMVPNVQKKHITLMFWDKMKNEMSKRKKKKKRLNNRKKVFLLYIIY